MILTRLALNSARRGGQKLLGSPHALHAAVLASFPPGDEVVDGEGRVLWRVDDDEHAHHLYVLSPTRPDVTHLEEQAGWPTRSTVEQREYRTLLDRLAEGQTWAFRLRANPVKAARDIGKRVGHVTPAQQAEWLLGRAEKAGFTVLTDGEVHDPQPRLTVSRREKKSFRRDRAIVTLVTAQFDGILRVDDTASLRRALVNGLGRGKAYGCGLLTLASVRGES